MLCAPLDTEESAPAKVVTISEAVEVDRIRARGKKVTFEREL